MDCLDAFAWTAYDATLFARPMALFTHSTIANQLPVELLKGLTST